MNRLVSNRISLARRAVQNPVFVVGTMRSGTGFMGLFLNEIPHFIGCPFELRRIWNNIGGVPIASDVCGNICPGLDNNFLQHVNVNGLKDAFIGEVLKNMRDNPVRQPRFLSKNPHLSNKILLVDKLFPNAQFIWTIRSLEDVVCSLVNLFEREEMQKKHIRHIWPREVRTGLSRCFEVEKDPNKNVADASYVFPGGDVHYLGEYWLETNRALKTFADQFGQKKIVQVHQEDILSRPERIRTKISEFLEIESAILPKLKNRIDQSQMKRWKRKLNRDEIRKLKEFLSRNQKELDEIYSDGNLTCNG